MNPHRQALRGLQLSPGARTHRPYPTPLPPRTLVQRRPGGQLGIVQNYHPDALPAKLGTFPVQWHNTQWEICGPDDVIPIINSTTVP
jgi:hypothetical protein